VFLLSSYGESAPKAVCETCQPKIKKEVAKLRSRTPIDVALFSPEERTRIEQGKLSCENCAESFSVFRGPQKCSNCSDIVCFKVSVLSHRVLSQLSFKVTLCIVACSLLSLFL
jgi:hypothetical protein